MIKFLSLTLRNFLSYGNNTTVINLDRPGSTLIAGEDLDNTANGKGANGVGKTVILNAITFALYDKTVSKISKDNLVNNVNKKNMHVTITFCIGDMYYHIVRARKTRAGAAGNYVKLYRRQYDANFTEEDEVAPDSMGNTNKFIEETILKIPYELFVRIVVFAATNIPFLDLPQRHPTQPNQTKFIEELFDLTTLSEKAELLKNQIKETDKQIEIQTIKQQQLEKERERHRQQVQAAKLRVLNWETSTDETIAQLENKLQKIKNVNIEQQQKLHEKATALQTEINTALAQQRELEKRGKALHVSVTTAQSELQHLRDEKCPYCLQKYESGKDKISENEKIVEEAEKEITEITIKLKRVETEISNLTEKYKTTHEKITVSNLDELIEIKNQSNTMIQRIQDLKSQENPYLEPLQELEDLDIEDVNYESLNELNKHVEHQKFLLKLLTKKDSFVRKVLLNKYIPYLNTRLQHYLQQLGLPHQVVFTHELTAEINQFGRSLDFGNLSAGQRARVNLALSFAFRDVLQSLHTRVNLCILDEALDVGLDTIGVQAAAKMLKRKGRDENLSVYIISHRDEIDDAFDRRLTIQMSKGFSYVKE